MKKTEKDGRKEKQKYLHEMSEDLRPTMISGRISDSSQQDNELQ